MTFGGVLRFTGLTVAVTALSLLIAAIVYIPFALFCFVVTVLGLGTYCVGCLIPERTDDPVN